MTQDLLKPPPAINFSRVLEYTVLDQCENYSGHGDSLNDGERVGPVACLAIGRRVDESGVSLFHCDRAWTVLGIAPCASLFEARHVAERIYPGILSHWIDAQISEEEVAWYLYQIWGTQRCHFCGKEAREITRLIEKNGARICDLCVTDCYQLLSEDDAMIAVARS